MSPKKTEQQKDNNSKLIDIINKKFGRKIACKLEDSENANTKEFISTGSSILDIYVSNRKCGGVPVGRVTVVEGEEQTGKSLVAAHIAADTLKRSGTVIYLDNEHAVNESFFKRIGVDTDKIIYVSDCQYMEQVFEIIEQVAISHREDNPDDLLTIVWDSVAATPSKAETEKGYDEQTMGAQAKVMSTSLRKIIGTIDKYKVCLVCVNQVRYKIARPGERVFGDMLISACGKALQFYASAIIRLRKSSQIKDEHGNIMGCYVNAKVVKTKFGPPMRNCDINVYFSHGIDDADAWLDVLKKYEIVKNQGSYFNCETLGLVGDKKFQTADWKEMLKDLSFKEKVRQLLENALVIDYDKVDLGKMVLDNVDARSYSEVDALANLVSN